ncbi:LysR family transcriptional regulator [Rhizobium sp. 18065]|uniref:LysR family transcriptional regulator n=1 Tax=Rhizobium sp. 18065 TaxID=2681411 RepID=UPI00135B02B2|nr:LysR family transcriptional regulator [Rhizobium sp. 18065]
MRYNLRHLRVFLAVVETGSVTRAAEICCVSQPAVTQAISKIEKMLGYPLFTRSTHGLFVNDEGKLLAVRARRAFAYLDPALTELASRLKVTATSAQLEALVAVRELENFTLAARQLGVAQPTVHRAVSQLEREAARPLFERTSYGMVATRLAQNLAQATRLAFAELQQAEADLAEARAEEAGVIVVGAMPLSRSSILPSVIASFREKRPKLPIKIVEGVYAELLGGLRRGELDFLIGAMRNPLPIDDVEQETLFKDTVVIVAGKNHPLVGKSPVSIDDLASYPWVVATSGTPIRTHFEALFQGHLPRPTSVIESSSLILMRELLDRSDHLGFISGGQASAEIERGLMASLPFDLAHTSRPIGLTTRKGWLPTAAQAAFLDDVRTEAKTKTSHGS